YGHGIVPRDSLEAALAFCAGALHRIFQPVGMIDAIEIARYLLAQKAAREGMIPVAAQVDRLAVLHLHDHAARVGAVMRADGAYGPGWAGNHGNSGHHRPTASAANEFQILAGGDPCILSSSRIFASLRGESSGDWHEHCCVPCLGLTDFYGYRGLGLTKEMSK